MSSPAGTASAEAAAAAHYEGAAACSSASCQLLLPDVLWCMVPLLDGQGMLALLQCCKEAVTVWAADTALQVRWLLCEQERLDAWAASCDSMEHAAEQLRIEHENAVGVERRLSWLVLTMGAMGGRPEAEQRVRTEVQQAEAAGVGRQVVARRGACCNSIARALRSRRPALLKELVHALQRQGGLGQAGSMSIVGGGSSSSTEPTQMTEQQQEWFIRALISVAAAGDADSVHGLLSLGPPVNCNQPLPNGRTALAAAALGGRTECVRLLLQDFDGQPLEGRKALRRAACLSCRRGCGSKACLGDLMGTGLQGVLFQGAKDTLVEGELRALVQREAGGAWDLGWEDRIVAAAGGLGAAAGQLMEGALLGATPCAACMAALLTVRGFEPPRSSSWLELQTTPLIIAARWGLTACVATLLAHPRTDVNSGDWLGLTALVEATSRGHHEVVQLLLAVPGIKLTWRLHSPLARLGIRPTFHVRDAATTSITEGLIYGILCEQAKCLRLLQAAERLHPPAAAATAAAAAGSVLQQAAAAAFCLYQVPSRLFAGVFVALVHASDAFAAALVGRAGGRRRVLALPTNLVFSCLVYLCVYGAQLAWICCRHPASLLDLSWPTTQQRLMTAGRTCMFLVVADLYVPGALLAALAVVMLEAACVGLASGASMLLKQLAWLGGCGATWTVWT